MNCCRLQIVGFRLTWSKSYNRELCIYNASALKICIATSSLVRFEHRSIFFYYEKRSRLLLTNLAL
jgi:hypothetical protein